MENLDMTSKLESSAMAASAGNRIVAMLIDVALMIAASVVLGVIRLGTLANAVSLAYLLTRDSLPFLNGQSIGKRLMKIRAVSLDDQPLTNNWGPGLIRNAVLLIPFFPLVELIVLLTNKEGLRLGDQWAKTRVVNEAA